MGAPQRCAHLVATMVTRVPLLVAPACIRACRMAVSSGESGSRVRRSRSTLGLPAAARGCARSLNRSGRGGDDAWLGIARSLNRSGRGGDDAWLGRSSLVVVSRTGFVDAAALAALLAGLARGPSRMGSTGLRARAPE